MRVHILFRFSSMTGADMVLSLWSLIAVGSVTSTELPYQSSLRCECEQAHPVFTPCSLSCWCCSFGRLQNLEEVEPCWRKWVLGAGLNIYSMGSLPGCTCSVTVALHSCCHHDGLCPFKLQTKTKHSSLKLLLVKNLLGHSNEKSRIVF